MYVKVLFAFAFKKRFMLSLSPYKMKMITQQADNEP